MTGPVALPESAVRSSARNNAGTAASLGDTDEFSSLIPISIPSRSLSELAGGKRPGRLVHEHTNRQREDADRRANLVEGTGLGGVEEGTQAVELGVRVVALTSLAFPAMRHNVHQSSQSAAMKSAERNN